MARLAFSALVAACIAAALAPGQAQPTTPGCYASAQRRSPLRADVDGDGRADRVSVTARRISDTECRFTAAVAGAGGWSATRRIAPDNRNQGFSPRLLVLAKIDGTRGADIVIERNEASEFSLALVMSVRHRRLVTLPAPQNPLNAGGFFTYYNGIGEGGGTTQVDCTKPGTVVTSGFRWLSTGPDPYGDPHYYAERRTYRVTGTRFQQVAATVIPNADRTQAEGILVPPLSAGEEIYPFPSCAVTAFN